MITPQQAREVARRAVELTGADQAEALVTAEKSALTRFANNRISQNVAEVNAVVSIRAVLGGRVGVASTNRLEDSALAETAAAAIAAARAAVEDPDFPGLPKAGCGAGVHDRASQAAREYGAEERAAAVGSIVAQSASRGLTCAGKVRVGEHVVSVANSNGIDVGAAVTGVQSTVLSMAPDGGSGWASFLGKGPEEFHPVSLGDEAATLAQRSGDPTDLEPGAYPVVLAPEAVADILDFLAYVGLSAKAVEEERSFMSGHIGEQLMAHGVSIADDALSTHALGLPFDYEGVPKSRVELVSNGVAVQPVTDSYWAAKTGRPNTGHALPAPNSYGPMPLNLEMAAGGSTLQELIGGVDRGVYVTRFHYVNVEDPIAVLLTGMTRDGTFLIENGRLTRPLKNLRFTQGAVEALAGCEGVTQERRFVGTEDGAALAPGLLLRSFSFTGQTA